MNAHLSSWNLQAADFPFDGASDEILWQCVRYATLAPSTHNSQPWLFKLSGNVAELHADFTRSLPAADPDGRELFMSCGAALFQLQLAMRFSGHQVVCDCFPDDSRPGLIARVRLGLKKQVEAEDTLLFHAITKRRTNRLPFHPDPIPEALMDTLRAEALKEGAWLDVVSDEETRHSVAGLVAEADRIQWHDRKFRGELANWTVPNNSNRPDGIPGYAEGVGDVASNYSPFVIRTFDLGKGRAARDQEIAMHSPALVVLGTYEDTPAEWVSAGQALGRVLLRARVEDVWASFLNQAIEISSLRPKVALAIARDGFPQLILRLGFGQEVRPTARRPLSDVVIHSRDHTSGIVRVQPK